MRQREWTPEELKEYLSSVVDDLSVQPRLLRATPLDVALELLGEELEAFVLFVGKKDLASPQDERRPVAILRRTSGVPAIEDRIHATVRQWVREQEEPAS